jgi:hypothetical protein
VAVSTLSGEASGVEPFAVINEEGNSFSAEPEQRVGPTKDAGRQPLRSVNAIRCLNGADDFQSIDRRPPTFS